MSFSATLLSTQVMALPFTQLLLWLVQLTLLGGVLMFFRPLLIGIARALVLVVRPRPTKDELARRKLRDAKRAQAAVSVMASH
jgi:predicted PurR-regulated permease PerM